jgi:hypothetical protein
MGAWGAGTLENDTAMDFLGGLALDGGAAEDEARVRAAITAVVGGDGYLDQDEANEALAAAEVIAAAAGRPLAGEDPSASEYLETVAGRSPGLAQLAGTALPALDRVTADESELRELWEEGDAAHWLAAVDDLRDRLRG